MVTELFKLYESYEGPIIEEEVIEWAKINNEIIECETIEDIKNLDLGTYIGHGQETLAVFKNNNYIYKVYTGYDYEPFRNVREVIENFNKFFPEAGYTLEKIIHVIDIDVFFPVIRQQAIKQTFKELDINSLSPSIRKEIINKMKRKGFYQVESSDPILGFAFENDEGDFIEDIKPRNIGINNNGEIIIFDAMFRK